MQKKLLAALILIAGLSTGCQTYQTRTVHTRTTADRLVEQETQRRIAGRLETLEIEISRLSRELDAQRQNLETRCNAIETKSEENKIELIDHLSRQLEKLLQTASQPTSKPPRENAHGFEHIVRPGETLSTIASAYGASVKKLSEMNQIKDPNRLSVGQKLFIPE